MKGKRETDRNRHIRDVAARLLRWWERDPLIGAPPDRAGGGRRALAFAMGLHGRLGAGSPVRRLDDMLVALVLASLLHRLPVRWQALPTSS